MKTVTAQQVTSLLQRSETLLSQMEREGDNLSIPKFHSPVRDLVRESAEIGITNIWYMNQNLWSDEARPVQRTNTLVVKGKTDNPPGRSRFHRTADGSYGVDAASCRHQFLEVARHIINQCDRVRSASQMPKGKRESFRPYANAYGQSEWKPALISG